MDKISRPPARVALALFPPVLWLIALGIVPGGRVDLAGAESIPQMPGMTVSPFTTKDGNVLPPRLSLPPHHPTPLEGLKSLKRVSHRARPGDSISRLMIRYGVSDVERRAWIRAIEKHYSGKNLPVGADLHFYFSLSELARKGKKAGASLRALEVEINEDWALTWEKGRQGILFTKRERPYDVQIKTAGGTVEHTLFDDGNQIGLDPTLLSQLVDIFSWELDFDREVQKGDTFRVVYEERKRRGSTRKPLVHLLAAELVNAGRPLVAIYFEKEKGKSGYYDLDGRSLARAFLRYPLEFTSISSYFSHSRVHPILKVDRPHTGVDFVALRGTPIRAIGDGKVTNAGWQRGGYGRVIEIEHDFGYASRYAHLQGFAKGLRRGLGVKKGQVIGYVGSSGMVTGPHLHFELYKDLQSVDPLNFEFPREDKIEPALRRAFESLKQLLLTQLAATPHS